MSDLDKIREIFLTASDIDDETRADNAEKLREWESGLRQNQAFAAWQTDPITISILDQARKIYVETVLALGRDHKLSEDYRSRLFANQHAALWLISLIGKNPQTELAAIEREITKALNATNLG